MGKNNGRFLDVGKTKANIGKPWNILQAFEDWEINEIARGLDLRHRELTDMKQMNESFLKLFRKVHEENYKRIEDAKEYCPTCRREIQ